MASTPKKSTTKSKATKDSSKKKIFEYLVCQGFTKEAILYVLNDNEDSLNLFCIKNYGKCYDGLIKEIDYAANINQDKKRPYTVYMHIAPNGKKYIGITKCKLNKRWGNGRGYWANQHFTNAINKYGWDNIQHAILYMRLTKEEAEEKEKALIKRFNTNNKLYGYNIEGGGSLNKEVSDSTREKLRQNSLGKHPSEETRKKMSESHKGMKCHLYGKHLSEEHKENLRQLKSKKVLQIGTDGNVIAIYPSMKSAAEKMNVTRQAISSCCTGKTKQCKGYLWRWQNG